MQLKEQETKQDANTIGRNLVVKIGFLNENVREYTGIICVYLFLYSMKNVHTGSVLYI